MKRPFSGALLGARIFFGLAFNMFQTLFSLYAIARFNLPANQTGYILTFVGVLSVFTQAFFVGQMTKRFRDDVLIMGAVVVLALALFGWALTPSIPVLLVVLVPTALSAGILNVLLSSTLTKSVTPDEIGGILGLSNGLESLTRTVAPVFGGFILGSIGTWAPGALGGFIMLAAAVYVYFAIYNHPIAAEISARNAARVAAVTE
ncbi:MAG: MFS transporter [Anaerolineales bacterium]